MDREHFLQQVEHLHDRGQSIRTIAAALGVNRGRVERAVKMLSLQRSSRPGRQDEIRPPGLFVGRQREMEALRATLEQASLRLSDAITSFFCTASQRQPVVLILDNLHWADKPSLLFLEFVAREIADTRLLVVGTYRDVELARQHPLFHTLGELTREP